VSRWLAALLALARSRRPTPHAPPGGRSRTSPRAASVLASGHRQAPGAVGPSGPIRCAGFYLSRRCPARCSGARTSDARRQAACADAGRWTGPSTRRLHPTWVLEQPPASRERPLPASSVLEVEYQVTVGGAAPGSAVFRMDLVGMIAKLATGETTSGSRQLGSLTIIAAWSGRRQYVPRRRRAAAPRQPRQRPAGPPAAKFRGAKRAHAGIGCWPPGAPRGWLPERRTLALGRWLAPRPACSAGCAVGHCRHPDTPPHSAGQRAPPAPRPGDGGVVRWR